MFGIAKMAELITIQALLKRSVRLYGDKVAFHIASNNGIQPITFRKFADDVEALGTALLSNGWLAGRRIGIIGKNSYEWGVTYFAVMNGGGTVVPLDKELTTKELGDSIERVKLNTLFYSEDVKEKIDDVKKQAKSTDFIPTWNKTGSLAFTDLLADGYSLFAQGDVRYREISIKPDACAALLFTSGTTSQSKIVMLSQRNIMLDMQRGAKPYNLTTDDKFLSILPLHHMFECNAGFLVPLYSGSSIYFSRGIRYIAEEFKEQQPTVIICVPRVVDALSAKIWKGIRTENKERTVRIAIAVTNRLGKLGSALKRRLFARIHDELGGRVRFFLSGAAPLNLHAAEDMTGLGFALFQGYGLTECAPAVAISYFGNNDLDSVGSPLQGTKIKILEPDENGVGEVLVKGPQVMLGYYKNKSATTRSMLNGYFRTGDLGCVKDNGCLKIIGRQKNIIVLSNGKKIYPEEIESLLLNSPAIKDAIVHGVDSGRGQKVCASIVLPDSLSMAERKNLEAEARQHVHAVNTALANYEQIQTIVIRDADFIRTSTLKVKRHLINA